THIGGMTIHSWSGLGIRDQLSSYDLDMIGSNEKVVKRAKSAQVLVIDEISMLDGKVLDMVDQILRTVRQKPEAFGGMQVVFVGDFFQLPPVTRQGDMMRYAFESRAWDNLKPLICYITEQYRQEDELLLGLLGSIRRNEIEDDHYTLLQEQTEIAFEHLEPTRLYTHNADVDAVNTAKLAELPAPARVFKMTGTGRKPLIEGLMKNCISPQHLTLKEDAMVMCTKNNFEAGYVNGTLARVSRFEEGYPVIETTDGQYITIKPTTWEIVEDKKVLASIEQLPLRLAWAITVHKSQGMSLDAAEIDLSKAFVYGQGYVALSRVRSLDGLKVLGMHPNALQVDPKIVVQDKRFYEQSDSAEEAFEEMEEGEVEEMHERFVVAQGGKIPKPGEIGAPKTSVERIQKESTFAMTKMFLKEGKSIGVIAKERGIAESTVWTHVEKLATDGEVTIDDVKHLEPKSGWMVARRALDVAIQKHGTERLKALYEETNEKYDYSLIRLARVEFLLEGKETVF
ncbi:MAG: helix-turn-helix domain-containing protein, partial [Candidatus Pacebacteria bacterium]|nr:helix-turn-helix domain-containing protein [Candidatus Paceibacterota bacterium]